VNHPVDNGLDPDSQVMSISLGAVRRKSRGMPFGALYETIASDPNKGDTSEVHAHHASH
jgi:hypothetical protein